MYAPKADPFLRKEWQKDFPADHFTNLKKMGEAFSNQGVKWGIGLTPFEIFHDFNEDAKDALKMKLKRIDELNPDVLEFYLMTWMET